MPVLLARRAGLFLGIELPEPSQCVQTGQEAILASSCDDKPRQSFEAHGKWTSRKTIGVFAPTSSRDGIFRGASSEEAAIVHPLRLDELELPPEIGSDKSKHQSPLHAIVFKDSIRKGRSIRGSTTDHPVDPDYTRHVRIAGVHPANMRAAGSMIANHIVFLKEESVVSPWVCAEFRVIVHRT